MSRENSKPIDPKVLNARVNVHQEFIAIRSNTRTVAGREVVQAAKEDFSRKVRERDAAVGNT